MKRRSSESTKGLYLYGFVRTDEDLDFGPIGVPDGGEPGKVHTITNGPVAAVVSPISTHEKLLPLRKNLAPHNAVIREIMKTMTIVPMAFGHVARGEEEIKRALKRNREALLSELERLWSKVEMGLKVKWDVDNIFEHVLARDPELSALRDQLFGRASAASQAEKIELGRMFEDRLSQERDREVERITEALRPQVADVKIKPPKTELTIMDLAFLVDRDGTKTFEDKVCQIAATYPAEYIFDYSGPWAPFDFVDVDLSMKSAEVV